MWHGVDVENVLNMMPPDHDFRHEHHHKKEVTRLMHSSLTFFNV
jgi:hypothetical protein